MALPMPQYSLDGSCSALFNNTLFTYSSVAFQSLKMVNDAAWETLEMGVPVSGGVCVKSTPVNDTSAAALYIVGGTSTDTSYPGLQRYTFSNQSWETITPTVPVTQNRLYHAAVYLNTSDTILVFAGTQDGSMQLSSQTFTIQAETPFTVLAYEAIAPPAISPILMQWSESKAMYMGGSDTNQKAMIFSPSKSWVDSNATFANPVYNTSNVKALVINGDDASKNIYTLDMTTSPNTINRTVLIDADGNPVKNAAPVVETNLKERKRAELTVADWPVYNDTLVPTTTRSSYSIAKDQSGMVVISGGNDQDVLCIFKARANTWVNATAKLGSKSITEHGLGTAPSSTISPSASSTASALPESSVAAVTYSSDDKTATAKVVGAVLGSTAGLALIMIALLVLFRWRQRRREHFEAGHQRRASGLQEKNDMDFMGGVVPRGSTRGGRRGSTRRSSGWNRYWSGGSSLNILGFGSKRTTYDGSDRSSGYSEHQMPSRNSAIVPPLNLDDRLGMNRVMSGSVISGSPTVQSHPAKVPLSGGMSGQIERPASVRSSFSYDDRYDAFSSGVPANAGEQNIAWTPVERRGGWETRASNYSESIYTTALGRSTANFDDNNNRSTRFPGAEQPAVPQRPHQADADMSWLNLGGNSKM
ncbi:pre-mRNA splicing factor CLF1 [Diplocarpon rosae]|nr:pre-mRNA splicing factor CLF1 [Diplocarpon rosae]